jgi:hypothetical protein
MRIAPKIADIAQQDLGILSPKADLIFFRCMLDQNIFYDLRIHRKEKEGVIFWFTPFVLLTMQLVAGKLIGHYQSLS